MNVLELCAGIGGLSLGLERVGMTVVGQVEIDPYCRTVLATHWPEVAHHDDIRTTLDWWHSAPRPAVDLVAAGFPCQPVSYAGRGAGEDDERWLWPDVCTVLRGLRPDYVLLENVPGLLGRGAGSVLGDLAACGYDAEWDCLPAAAVGACHRRDRWFCVAYPESDGRGAGRAGRPAGAGPHRQGLPAQELAHPDRAGLEGAGTRQPAAGRRPVLADSDERGRDGRSRVFGQGRRGQPAYRDWWAVEPGVGRVADGVPGRVERLHALGNAVVPQVAEHLGRLILTAAGHDTTAVAGEVTCR